MADIALDNIGGASCEPMGGIEAIVYFAEHSDFETIVDPKELCGDSVNAAATLEELVTIPSPGHTFKPGKKWNKLNVVLETGEITSTQIGEKGRRLFQNQLTFQVAGSDPTILGLQRLLKNKKLMCLVTEVGSGQVRQFGSKRLPAWIESQEHKVEATLEGNNAATFTIMDKQKGPAPIYKGDVLLTAAPVVET